MDLALPLISGRLLSVLVLSHHGLLIHDNLKANLQLKTPIAAGFGADK
jgi:hypothetical protein